VTEPGGGETCAPVFGEDLGDCRLIGFGRRGRESECYFGQAEFEEPVSAPRLAVIISLGSGACEDLNLTVVKAEAAIDCRDLGFEGALVGQYNSCRAALNDRWRNLRDINIGKRLCSEDDAHVLLTQRF
jgi:hypothetical protein